jgi:UDP-glucose 4-epimerase
MSSRPAILVTGGAGYIGSHCCRALDAAGYQPVTYDNLSTGHRSFVARTLVFGDDYDTPDGTAIRDYIHATDLAAAHVLALKLLLEGHSGGAFNLGTGNGFSVREILAAIAAETGRQVPHLVKPRRSGDPTYLVADPSAARDALNFRPTHSDLATIIRTAWAWHNKAHPLKTGGPIEPSRPRTG